MSELPSVIRTLINVKNYEDTIQILKHQLCNTSQNLEKLANLYSPITPDDPLRIQIIFDIISTYNQPKTCAVNHCNCALRKANIKSYRFVNNYNDASMASAKLPNHAIIHLENPEEHPTLCMLLKNLSIICKDCHISMIKNYLNLYETNKLTKAEWTNIDDEENQYVLKHDLELIALNNKIASLKNEVASLKNNQLKPNPNLNPTANLNNELENILNIINNIKEKKKTTTLELDSIKLTLKTMIKTIGK